MSVLTIRLPEEKHDRLRAMAQSRGLSANRLLDELTTIALAQHDTWVWFRAEAAKGDPQSALKRLDRLDQVDLEASTSDPKIQT